MAMTPLLLAWLGSLAAGVTFLGLFVDAFDRWTHVLLTFLGAGLWATFAVGGMDVIVRDSAVATASEPVWMLVYPGVGMTVLVALFGVRDLLAGAGQETSERDVREVFR